MRGASEVQLYAIQRHGALTQFPTVRVGLEQDLPSGGALSNPNDRELIKGLEDAMIDAFGYVIVELKCKAIASQGSVDLSSKLLRPQHVSSLMAAVEQHKVSALDLSGNHLGAAGAEHLVAALKANTTVTELVLWGNGFDDAAEQALKAAVNSGVAVVLQPFEVEELEPL
jgi:hypothetical protein